MIAYHDDEWGRPITGDVEHFERLALESFQAGLSWSTILHKRPAFRAAFRGFDPAVVAAFDDTDRARLMADAGIVRNRSKIDVTIVNARLFLDVVGRVRLVRGVSRDDRPAAAPSTAGRPPRPATIPVTTPESDALSADLRRRGFRFVGFDDRLRPHAEHRPRRRPPADVFPVRRRVVTG